MISVTENAKRVLKTMLTAYKEADPEKGLRLLPNSKGEFALALDTELAGDQVVEYQGSAVLLVGIEYFKLLDGKMVDCRDTEDRTELFVH
ncbi:hypothetical protein ES703_75677 [subsurface metagenome]